MLTDDAVAGALDVRHEALLGNDPEFGPGETPSTQVVAAYSKDFASMCPEPELAQILDWGILLGASLARNNVEIDESTKRWLPVVEHWTASTLQQDPRTGVWTVRDADNEELIVEPGAGVWLLHTPYGKNRPWARGLWRSLARWCLIKQLAQRDWARHSEIGARLFAQTQLDRDGNAAPTTEEQRQQIVDEIANAGGELVAALPPGWTIQLLELTANTEAIYKAQIEAANNAIRIRIRGGDLSSDAGGGGSFAAAESQAKTNDHPKRRYDNAALTGPTLQEQHAAVWAEYNFGSRSLAPAVKFAPKSEPAPVAEAAPVRRPFGAVPEVVAEGADPGDAVTPKPGEGPKPDSGTAPADAGDTVDATAFADGLATEAATEAQRASEDMVARLQAVINAATSPDDLERRLREAFADADISELAAITEKAAVLAELAGRYAVLAEL